MPDADSRKMKTGFRVSGTLEAGGRDEAKITLPEGSVLVRVGRLVINGEEAGGYAMEGNGIRAAENVFLFPEGTPVLKIPAADLSGRKIAYELFVTPLEPETASELARGILASGEALKKKKDLLNEKQEAAVQLQGTKAMRAMRALSKKSGKGEPFAALRPLLTDAEAGITCVIDMTFIHRDHLRIIGWAADRDGTCPKIVLRDETGKLLPAEQVNILRSDVTCSLKLPAERKIGFIVNADLADIRCNHLSLEMQTDEGYTARDICLSAIRNGSAGSAGKGHMFEPGNRVEYNFWINERLADQKTLEAQRRTKLADEMLISIVIPLYNTPLKYLEDVVRCVMEQSYEHVELCLADGSTNDDAEEYLKKHWAKESRIVYRRLEKNGGISENTNAAIALARGEWIMLADHDDLIEPDACFEIASLLDQYPDADVIYSDEDKTDEGGGVFFDPYFKPDYNPDLLACNDYMAHIFSARKSLVEEVGLFRPEFDGAQDFDLALRCCEKARRVCHIPRILYHWRAHEASTAGNPHSKDYAFRNGAKAIQAHYDRLKIPARVEMTEDLGRYRTHFTVTEKPLVSVIIPSMDHIDILDRALQSIFRETAYPNYEIILAENNSRQKETFAYYEKITAEHRNVRVVTWTKAFNYSAVNNFAEKEAKGEYLLFLNNDVEVISGDWMEEMLAYCLRGDVGAVGAKLLYPNGTVQHCGVVVGLGGIAGHICVNEPKDSQIYFGRIYTPQDVEAVTAACMMTKKSVFEKVGGFDEDFRVSYNDIDYCLKVRHENLLIVYSAWSELIHYESVSRGSDEEAVDPAKHARQMEEADRLKKKWPEVFRDGDPYFNPNFAKMTSLYMLQG